MAIWGMGVVLGPILGPLIGGWLTEDYSWRWVFFVNVPFGILAAIGIAATLPETTKQKLRFDMFGFATLSLGIGALQMMLDRGELKDWFSSTEIQIEAFIAAIGLFLFIAHTATAENTFISRGLFKDRNFVIGNIFIGMIGVVLFATLALMPPMLQGLMGYPVLAAGHRHRAPRRGNVGLDARRRSPGWQGRWALADRHRLRPVGHLSGVDVEHLAAGRRASDHLVGRDPGLRHGPGVCVAHHRHVRHAAGGSIAMKARRSST